MGPQFMERGLLGNPGEEIPCEQAGNNPRVLVLNLAPGDAGWSARAGLFIASPNPPSHVPLHRH